MAAIITAISGCTGVPSPESTTRSVSALAEGASIDDGAWIVGDLRHLVTGDAPVERAVDLADNVSNPWVVGFSESTITDLWVVYNVSTGTGCGKHVGFEIVETDQEVVLAAVSEGDEPGAECAQGAEPTAGIVVLETPLGERSLLHAKVSRDGSLANVALPTEPGPTVAEPIEPVPYTGTATCDNLVDRSTANKFRSKDWDVTGDGYTANIAAQPRLFLSHFLEYGGIVCGWGVNETTLQYAYGPITDTQAETEKFELLAQGGTISQEAGSEVITFPGSGPGQVPTTIAFGDGFWAYGIDYGGGNHMDEVIRNAPEFLDSPIAP